MRIQHIFQTKRDCNPLRLRESAPTCRLVCRLGHKDGVLVLCPPVDVVDVVSPVVGVVYPLPPERKLVLVTVLRPLLLDPGQPRVEPVRGA